MNEIPFLVAGAGPSGLAFGRLMQPHARTVVLEKSGAPAGLAASIEHGGGVFDIGGHSFHTPHPEMMDFITGGLGVEMESQKRDARVWFRDRFISYPFQQFFRDCGDEAIVRECEDGRSKIPALPSQANFEAWLLDKFGGGICRHFMLPYNCKLWGGDLQTLCTDWVAQRVPCVQKQAFPDCDLTRKPLESDTTVSYPAQGGFGSIYRRMAEGIRELHLHTELETIDPVRRTASCRNGETFHFARLVYTGPLTRLPGMVKDFPDDLAGEISRLRAVPLKVALLLVNKQLRPDIQRIYSGDPAWMWHKLALNHNSSTSLRRRPVHAITAEISSPGGKGARAGECIASVISNLLEMGIIASPGEVAWSDLLDVPFGYPVQQQDTACIVRRVMEWARANHIHFLGRFGTWSYINSDTCIKQAMDLCLELRPSARQAGSAAKSTGLPA